jgi:hypothetical protein
MAHRPEEIAIQRPTRTHSDWRGPALALVAVLVGLVVLSRLDSPEPLIVPAPMPTAAAVLSTEASVTSPTPGLPTLPSATNPPSTIGGAIGRTPDSLHYADGIPTGISGESVFRVGDALLVPLGRTLLVAGWYTRIECEQVRPRRRCGSTTLSDAAIEPWHPGWLATSWIEMDTRLWRSGAWIVRATVEEDADCSIPRAGSCHPRLRLLETVWSADYEDLLGRPSSYGAAACVRVPVCRSHPPA